MRKILSTGKQELEKISWIGSILRLSREMKMVRTSIIHLNSSTTGKSHILQWEAIVLLRNLLKGSDDQWHLILISTKFVRAPKKTQWTTQESATSQITIAIDMMLTSQNNWQQMRTHQQVLVYSISPTIVARNFQKISKMRLAIKQPTWTIILKGLESSIKIRLQTIRFKMTQGISTIISK